MTKKQKKDNDRAEAIAKLREMLKPGDRVYTVLKHVSSSGMSRSIDLLIPYRHYDNIYPPMPADRATYPGQTDYEAKPTRKYVGVRIMRISWLAARAMDRTIDQNNGGIKIGGYGMDMGFSLVYDLGRTLWPKGTPKPHGKRNGEPDSDGGYALKQEWL